MSAKIAKNENKDRLVTITELASRKAKEYIRDYAKNARKSESEATGLRIKAAMDSCDCLNYSLEIDSPQINDTIVEDKGVKVYLDPESLRYAKGTKIDYVESAKNPGFSITNSKDGCGPGCSCE
jgi:iron-sulfur cluster assembly protein